MKTQDQNQTDSTIRNVVITKTEQSHDPMSFKNLLERFYRMNAVPKPDSAPQRQQTNPED